jgi:hypothetical protein
MIWHWIRILVPRWYSPAFHSYREAGGAGSAEIIIDLLMLACTSPRGCHNGELWRSVDEPHTVTSLARILRREDVVVAAQIETMRRFDIVEVRSRDGQPIMRLTWWDDQLPAAEARTRETARKQKLRKRKKEERQAIVDGLLPEPQGWREALRDILPGWPDCKWLEVPPDYRMRVAQRLLPL